MLDKTSYDIILYIITNAIFRLHIPTQPISLTNIYRRFFRREPPPQMNPLARKEKKEKNLHHPLPSPLDEQSKPLAFG